MVSAFLHRMRGSHDLGALGILFHGFLRMKYQ
jgi:hypothetical protein